ncbi:MAG: NAD(+) diphosphatase [Actinomycetota bacterium]|nr:NAD(+) diphosphatase [Actinomycetota bacterium]
MSSFLPLVEPPPDHVGPSRWYVVRQSGLLTTPEGAIPVAAGPAELGVEPDGPPVFVGLDGDVACWAVGVDAGTSDPDPLWWQALWVLGLEWETEPWMLAGRAVQLVEWVRTNRFCGRCGTETIDASGERARRCPACGLTAYPRLAPAVIVLIRREDEALLALGRGFKNRMFSALAGFVEPGENLEEAVRREVLEEVGVTVGGVTYVGSQPWPFPHSLMIGFEAEWEAGEIAVDGNEILEAGWFRKESLPSIPPPMSIARSLIDRWITDEVRRPAAHSG